LNAPVLTSVSESLKELEDALESGKRLSIGVLKYKHTSNDFGDSKPQVQAAGKKKQTEKVAAASVKRRSNDKPVVLKVIINLKLFLLI